MEFSLLKKKAAVRRQVESVWQYGLVSRQATAAKVEALVNIMCTNTKITMDHRLRAFN